jgi:hypothetical protein
VHSRILGQYDCSGSESLKLRDLGSWQNSVSWHGWPDTQLGSGGKYEAELVGCSR